MSSSSAPAACSLPESFAIHCRVIWALMMREMITMFGRHGLGFAWIFVMPMILTVGITLAWSLRGVSEGGADIPIAAFALTGYSTLILYRNMPSTAASAVKMNVPLLYHRNVRIVDLFLARIILQISAITFSLVTLTIIFSWIGLMPPPRDPLTALNGWMATACFGIGLGFFIGSIATKHEWVDHVWHPFSYILGGIAGAALLMQSVPPKFREMLLWFPIVHGAECLRDGYFGDKFTPYYDLSYEYLASIVLLFLGLLQIRSIRGYTETYH
ncbi:MAG: ABC transporter permease [Verrucomicrobia bacterium]|nr:ABC transporter permease [Verrucomicrobiota bacterium]